MHQGKRTSLVRCVLLGLASTAFCLGTAAPAAGAGPAVQGSAETGGEHAMPVQGKEENLGTVAGTTVVSQVDGRSYMVIRQNTPRAVIYWDSFQVGRASTVDFIQLLDGRPNPAAMTLNHITGHSVSVIDGNINSIGSLIFINPNGMVFSEGSGVQAAGLVASTAQLLHGDQNFYAGGPEDLAFAQDSGTDSNLILNGRIRAETNGAYIIAMKKEIGALNQAIADCNCTWGSRLAPALEASVLNTVELRPATRLSTVNNVIRLIADGDVTVGRKGSLQACTQTCISGVRQEEKGGYTILGNEVQQTGAILLRADQNCNELAAVDPEATGDTAGSTRGYDSGAVARYDRAQTGPASVSAAGGFKAAKVYLDNEDAGQIASPRVEIFYEPDITPAGLQGTATSAIGIGTTDNTRGTVVTKYFTQKDYTGYAVEAAAYRARITAQPRIWSNDPADPRDRAGNRRSTAVTADCTVGMLVNDSYQLQAVQDVSSDFTGVSKPCYYGSMTGGYALGRSLFAAETAKWTSDSQNGFDPLGGRFLTDPFGGSFTGNGYSIYDLHIGHLANNPGVGLFSAANNASLQSVMLVDPVISGRNYVGGIVGYMTGGRLADCSLRKRDGQTEAIGEVPDSRVNVLGNGDYVGGLVGQLYDGTIQCSANAAAVEGQAFVGGLVGMMAGSSRILDSHNSGFISDRVNLDRGQNVGVITGVSQVGGLAGSMLGNSSIQASAARDAVYNSGQVQGRLDVGGLVGRMADHASLTQGFNTNLAAPVGTAAGAQLHALAEPMAKSCYGQVQGLGAASGNIGGLVGEMAGGQITTAYNSGNVQGYQSVGGLVGAMSGNSRVCRAYNADNNTVLVQAEGVPAGSLTEQERLAAAGDYLGFRVGADTYAYDSHTRKWARNNDFRAAAEINPLELPAEGLRCYNNRLIHRDAAVTGTEKAGGLVGARNGGTLSRCYQGGTVNGRAPAAPEWSEEPSLSAGTAGTADWVGEEGAAPLLKAFMTPITIHQQYRYDGSTHELSAAGIPGIYGGAFFGDDSRGRNVHTEGIASLPAYRPADWIVKSGSREDITTDSSVYTYDSSRLWSPQHGCYLQEPPSLIITRAPAKAPDAGGGVPDRQDPPFREPRPEGPSAPASGGREPGNGEAKPGIPGAEQPSGTLPAQSADRQVYEGARQLSRNHGTHPGRLATEPMGYFLTVQGTGIHIHGTSAGENLITIDASSRTDGGGTVVIGIPILPGPGRQAAVPALQPGSSPVDLEAVRKT